MDEGRTQFPLSHLPAHRIAELHEGVDVVRLVLLDPSLTAGHAEHPYVVQADRLQVHALAPVQALADVEARRAEGASELDLVQPDEAHALRPRGRARPRHGRAGAHAVVVRRDHLHAGGVDEDQRRRGLLGALADEPRVAPRHSVRLVVCEGPVDEERVVLQVFLIATLVLLCFAFLLLAGGGGGGGAAAAAALRTSAAPSSLAVTTATCLRLPSAATFFFGRIFTSDEVHDGLHPTYVPRFNDTLAAVVVEAHRHFARMWT